MSEKDYLVEQYKIDVKRAEAGVEAAQKALSEGKKRQEARLAIIVSELEENYRHALLTLASEQLHLKQAQEEAERGYDA